MIDCEGNHNFAILCWPWNYTVGQTIIVLDHNPFLNHLLLIKPNRFVTIQDQQRYRMRKMSDFMAKWWSSVWILSMILHITLILQFLRNYSVQSSCSAVLLCCTPLSAVKTSFRFSWRLVYAVTVWQASTFWQLLYIIMSYVGCRRFVLPPVGWQ